MCKRSNERMEFFFLAVISDRLKGAWPSTLRFLLKGLSRVYRWVMDVRLACYEHRICRSAVLGCQVISIGNLTVGGTGKTPVVEVFARALQREGRRVAILSRGYKKAELSAGKKWKNILTFHPPEREPPRVVSDGRRLLLDSEQGGDEPYMLASNLPEVCVDDGFQYLKLQHRIDIVLVDRNNPFDNGFVLPRGLLRESEKHLRRASFIFITKSKGDGSPELRERIRELNPTAEIAECRHTPRELRDVFGDARQPLEFLKGKRVAAVSGIAAPRGFEESLERLGATLCGRRHFPDHHRYRQQEILDVINEAAERGAQLIVTTEKDAVRFPRVERRDIPVYFLRIEIELLSGEEDFNGLIKRICFKA